MQEILVETRINWCIEFSEVCILQFDSIYGLVLFTHFTCSKGVLKAIISHLTRMQTTHRYTVHADLLMLIIYRTVCLYVWMLCRAGWLLSGCSLTTVRPRCSGAHRHVASTRFLIVPFVSEAQMWILYLLCMIFWSCWIPGARTFLQLSKLYSARRSEHISPLFCELHWLRVP